MSAKKRPINAPESSSRTTGSSGFFVWRMKLHQLALFGFSRLASWRAVRNESASSTTDTSRITIATPKYSSSCGWRSFSMPSYSANAPPSVKSTTDTTNAQKNLSRP